MKNFTDLDSVLAPLRHSFTVAPSASEISEGPTRTVMVTVDDATITGIFIGDTTSSTTVPLKVGVPYPFMFKVISAVSAGSVKGYN